MVALSFGIRHHDQLETLKLYILLYQDSNVLVFCFEDLDIIWYHRLLTPLEFERQSSSSACFNQQVRRKIKIKTKYSFENQTVFLMGQ